MSGLRKMAGAREAPLVPGADTTALAADEVAAWMAKTEGLAAPQAPASGQLAPRSSGWLVGLGTTQRRLTPRLGRIAELIGLSATAGLAPQLLFLAGRADVATWWSVAALVALGMMPVGLLQGWTLLRAARERARAHTVGDPAGVPSGTHVHLRGTVVEQPTMTSLGAGTPAVICRNAVLGVDETRAIDFWVEVASGARIKVAAQQAILLHYPARIWREPPACGGVRLGFATTDVRNRNLRLLAAPMRGRRWWQWVHTRLRESVVVPGDQIDLWGVLEHELAPQGERGGNSRSVPLQPVLRARGKVHLFVRRRPAI